MKSIVIAIALATAWGPCRASAQTTGPALVLTLDDAVARGVAASHRLAEGTARREASAAAADGRQAALRPAVSALAGYTRTNHVDEFGILLPTNQLRVIYPDVPDNYRARLDLQWPIYTGGRVDAVIEAARLESAASAEDVEALRADVRLEITRAFWALVVAGESLGVVEASLARTGAHVQDARNQLEAGLVPPSDVFSARAQESRQRMLSIQARSARDVAEAELARLVGAPAGTAIRPDAVLDPGGDPPALDALVAQALDGRRDRRALLDRLSAARSREEAAAAGRRPTVAVTGGVDYARPNARIFPRAALWKESWDAGVNVSWPLFDGGRTRADMAEAAAGRRAVQARIDELDAVVALEIRQRLAEIQANRAAIAAADDSLEAATEARRVLGERFTAGVATGTDVLDAQMAVLQAGLDRTQAMAGVRLAEARLRRAVGQ